MEASQIPPEVQAAADKLGVPVETLLEHVQQQGTQEQATVGVTDPTAPAIADPTVAATAAETNEQRLERELAESRQETQQVRKMAQVATEGRVIGSAGGGVIGTLATDLPNIGMLEPGIRYEYLNGLIDDKQLEDKVGTLLAALLKKHEGGTV